MRGIHEAFHITQERDFHDKKFIDFFLSHSVYLKKMSSKEKVQLIRVLNFDDASLV